MEIISFEGLDKSGKHTQSELLFKDLLEKGYKVAKGEFHNYDSPTGELIRKWLHGEYDVDQTTIELIMTADKQAQQKYFDELEKEGYDYLILDRYTWSQRVYSSATNPYSGFNKSQYMEWVNNITKYIREPDYVIYIDVTPEESMKRKGQHGDNDRYESDFDLLTKAREEYLDMVVGNLYSDNLFFLVEGSQPVDDVWEEVLNIFVCNIKGR